MPLVAGKAAFKAMILNSYKTANSKSTYKIKAQEVALAVHALLLQAIPQTTVNGNAAPGQVVALFLTVSPSVVQASGSGGLDRNSPGSGLDSAKNDFIEAMVKSYSDKKNTYDKSATAFSEAIVKLFSEAKVMTNVTGILSPGGACPAPSGPLAPAPWSGTGQGGIESPNGTGMIVTSLASDLESIYKGTYKTHKEAITKLADALIKFAKTAKVTTIDQGQAGGGSAFVTLPIPPAYPGGDGSILSASPLIGSMGTGFIL